jgi:hypothetical protein
MSKLGSNSWKSYKCVLRNSALCFHKKSDDPETTQPQVTFELLKLMIKTTADDELRMFYGGEWFECRSSEGKADLMAWVDAISSQRAALYEKKTSAGLSPRPGDAVVRKVSGDKGKPNDGDAARRALEFGGLDAASLKSEMVLKRMDLMFLEYHRCELECELLANNLKVQKKKEEWEKKVLSLISFLFPK